MKLLASPWKTFMILVTLSALAAGTVRSASAMWTAYGENGQLTVCVNRGGAIRMVGSASECKQTETVVTWNAKGPAGQSCNEGEYVTGFDTTGNILCASAGGGNNALTDSDGDGWGTLIQDCNDADASISPGTSELVGDKLDNDCDGKVDEYVACPFVFSVTYGIRCKDGSVVGGGGGTGEDLDGDGWYSSLDCDDTMPSVHPVNLGSEIGYYDCGIK